jgi:coenzyme F420-reducing hydrogenase gamma subunit
VSTPHDLERIKEIREDSKFLVTIGACATAGGLQALRNGRDVDEFTRYVYASPEYITTLARSTPISGHIRVDLELRGCPISKNQLLETVTAFLNGRKPVVPTFSVCMECKRRGNPCIMVSHGTPCLGPITQAGCGAICPSFHRGCFGCFGPMESPNPSSLSARWADMGVDEQYLEDSFTFFDAYARGFPEDADVSP